MSIWSAKLIQLAETLPSDGDNSDLDDQARSVLRHLMNRTLTKDIKETATEAIDARQCPICGTAALSATTPYCSARCREEAAFVRQFRTGLISGAVLDHERQANLGQNLWHLLGGGYPRRVALIQPKAFAKILTNGCEVCGAEAVTVDHAGSG